MKRFVVVLFFMSLFLFAGSFVSIVQCQNRDVTIPAWVKQEEDSVYEKVVQYVNGDDAVVFPIITDLHLTSSGAYDHIDYVVDADRLFGFDCIVNLGDLGLDVSTDTRAKASALLQDVYRRHSAFRGTTLFAMGNHDGNRNYPNCPVTEREWISRFVEPELRKNPSLVYHKTYGYLDIPQSKTRLIVLNTTDEGNSRQKHSVNFYSMSDQQLNWLVSALKFKKSGWNVVVLTHFCASNLGKWNKFDSSMENADIFNSILHDFMVNKQGRIRNIRWDFSKNKSNALVANLCGDSHFDNSAIEYGFNRIITQGYGGVSESDLPKGAIKWNRGGNLLVDIVVLKPSKREFTLFRLGAGRDRHFTY